LPKNDASLLPIILNRFVVAAAISRRRSGKSDAKVKNSAKLLDSCGGGAEDAGLVLGFSRLEVLP
jgi:hypothetical protein